LIGLAAVEWIDSLVERLSAMPLWSAWVAIVLATFVSEDLTCVAAGLAAATGKIPAVDAIGAAAFGIWVGDLGLYAAGKFIGRPAIRRAPLSWFVHEEGVARSSQWFAAKGAGVILFTRFVPGTRLPTYFAAGLLEVGFWRFALLTALAVALWSPLLGGGALLIGREVLPLVESWERWGLLALFAAAFAWFLAIKFLVPAFTWRGRRMIVSRWRRMTRWEFWPPWLFYPPVVAYVAWLALKHRGLSVFTAVNPGVPAGGFIGESKHDILRQLASTPEFLARAQPISAQLATEERVRVVEQFAASSGFPIVLKPDAGQRGSGVAIVRSVVEARAYLERVGVDCIVQEYASGEEFGVFYYRYPSAESGRIFSITRKVFPKVRGDGKRTLEELILADARAVCMAKLYLARNAERLAHVPARGEEVQLVEIGNHCRGAVFLDGCALATPELEAVIDRISKGFEGFYFGRYDVRARSVADLQRGEHFKVIELNGATSEATHIYDPTFPLLRAWGVLFEQWRILFEIAAENRRRGAPSVGIGELLRSIGRYRHGARTHPS
jgi:membrane protein DedA with SNARE-associated domain